MKKLVISFIILVTPLVLMAQFMSKEKRVIFTLNNGLSETQFIDKDYFNGTFCGFDGPCFSQKFLNTKPAYFFDANLSISIGQKHQLGIGMSIYKMKYLLELDYPAGLFRLEGVHEREVQAKFNSYYLSYVRVLKEKKNTQLYWSNHVGLDIQNSFTNFEKINPIIRTGLIIENRLSKVVSATIQPFVQTGLSSFKKFEFRGDNQIRPITIGGTIGLKFHLMQFGVRPS